MIILSLIQMLLTQKHIKVFKENIKNNDDIVKNYINRFAKVLTMDKDGKLNITDYNPQKIFSFMDRNNKKAFFDNFSIKEESPTQYYQNSSLETKKRNVQYLLEKFR